MELDFPEAFGHQCFKSLWAHSKDAMFVVSVGGDDFCYQAMNDVCEKLLRVNAQDLIGQPLKTFYSSAVYELISTPFVQCATNQKTLCYEQMYDSPAETYSEWETTLTPVLGQTGRISYLMGQCRDITEIKAMQRSLAQLRKDADNAKKIKASFLANISHEMRTPVNGLLGAVDVVLNAQDESERRHFAEILRASADGLAQLTNDILDYAKLKTAAMPLQHQRFSLYEILQDIKLEKQSLLSRNRDSLQFHVEAIEKRYFYGDAHRVRQMIAILIGNAIKFTKDGEITVNIDISSEGADYQVVDIKVRDTGCGIAVDDLDQVFKPFKQLDESSTRKQGGLGLGLSICQQLAILMAGDLTVSSIQGQSSEFVLRLPLTIENELEYLSHQETDLDVLMGAKVLLVEDNPVNLMVAERLLKSHGLDVATVVNGKEALAYCENHNVDIVVMDWHMPEMDGIEATSKIRQLKDEKAKVPIIGLTANAQNEVSELFDDAGMNDVLSKPINSDLLINKLAHWLTVAH
ncbi:MAG: response regulator [Pseudomonadales bacterium]|nr:response regulator [Pseudomonadales bacterium]